MSKHFKAVGLQADGKGRVPVPQYVKRIVWIGCHDRYGAIYNRQNHELAYEFFATAKEWRESALYRKEVAA